ncbi:hypothetical protein L9F63_015461 [Diploptera punctata]|uniref:Uncharacterized protein n=1 Tax=Diploptera punctata TaxID=6984 RepID=A0AAD8A7P6_DIPPU|nr:hypothetical protein L9F63_015461 [Diploptera punctata]
MELFHKSSQYINIEVESSVYTYAESASMHLTFHSGEIELSAKLIIMKALLEISEKSKSTLYVSSINCDMETESTRELVMVKTLFCASAVMTIKTPRGSSSLSTTSTLSSCQVTCKTSVSTVITEKCYGSSQIFGIIALKPKSLKYEKQKFKRRRLITSGA